MRIVLIPLFALLLSFSQPLLAKDQDKEAAKARAEGKPAVTVFLDANWGNRTNGAAKALTELHQAWARHGYQLISLEPYEENGDLVGFFVSYRDAAADAKPR